MNKTLRNAGLIALGAAALAYPAVLLYRYVAKRRSEANENEAGEDHHTKSILTSYRGNHKPHRRKAEANGHLAN